MKRQFVFLMMMIAVVLSSCKQKEIEQLMQQNDELQTALEQSESNLNSLLTILNDIDENLTNIRSREERLLQMSASVEKKENQVDAIKEEIKAIDELMRKNRENLELLSNRLKTTTGEKQQLEKMITNLNKVVESKDQEIQEMITDMQDLNLQISDLYGKVSDLQEEKVEKEMVITEQDKALHQGFYRIGDSKELIELGLIVKSGGFLGLGRMEKLAEVFDPAWFNEIDIRETTAFEIDAKKVNLLTVHPSDSYIIRSSEDGKRKISFEITRTDEFWKASKY
ncbi:MAG TPA: hypothetical protein P5104_07295, partial [Bacteroidales bacterium]|nr:hypothetical protein [Bacteroidales bacterium]